MPPVQLPNEEFATFAVLHHEHGRTDSTADLLCVEQKALARNVNVVKPLQLEDEARTYISSANDEQVTDAMTAPAGPQTILDPKFTRALDFKLRRLKEKEILQANLRRPTRKPRNGTLAASNPNISMNGLSGSSKLSQSHPQIVVIPPDDDISKISPKMDSKNALRSPERKSRNRNMSDADKPRFVTTVKTGQFLLPPPEVACLLGLETLYPPQEREKIVYSYASKPKAVASRAKWSPAEKKEPNLCNGINNIGKEPIAGTKRPSVGQVFGGVRALVAGIAGIGHMLHKQDTGSVAPPQYANVMHDKRVVRGSAFASHPHAAGDGAESAAARAARTRRRALARRAAAARLRPGTPPPAPGRRHHPIQTEYYLEELFDKGVEMEVGVQTDLFADRPASPVYAPAKTGADAATQIYPGELFDFDLEVQPILEVLVGKTAEQALAEVAQEEELATLREQQRRYRELRDAELAERQRLAAQDLRLYREKERRVAEARAGRAAAVQARERAAAAALVQGYVAELLPAVLAGLRRQGYLLERARAGVDGEFMPWLLQEVAQEIESIITSRDVITEIVREVVEARAELYRGAGERECERTEPEESITPPSAPMEHAEEEEQE